MMKPVIFAISAALFSASALADTYVKPHVTKDGTYVEGHYRTAPNSTRLDNYSTEGNVNPYNGEEGTKPLIDTAPRYKLPKLKY
jgi:hypothetical protein